VTEVPKPPARGPKLSALIAAYEKMQRDGSLQYEFAHPAILRLNEQIDLMMAPMRAQQESLMDAIHRSTNAWAESASFARLQETITEAMGRLSPSTSMLADLPRIDEFWAERLHGGDRLQELAHLAAKITLAESSAYLFDAANSLARVNTAHLRDWAASWHTDLLEPHGALAGFLSSYDAFMTDALMPDTLARLPSYALSGASREVFVTGHTLRIVSRSCRTDETDDDCETDTTDWTEQESLTSIRLLGQVDPELARTYAGAREAYESTNPDRERHVLTSLRELWLHLLRRLAPSEEVLVWIAGRGGDLLYKGQPTHRALILYICRDLDHQPMSEFVDSDAKVLLKMLDLCNHLHGLGRELSDADLRALLLRTDSGLQYILQIAGIGKT